MLIGVSKLRLF